MKVRDVTELPREVHFSNSDYCEPKSAAPPVTRFALLVNTVIFELRKATIRLKCKMAQLARRNFLDLERQREEFRNSISYMESSFMWELGVQLSSVIPYTVYSSSSWLLAAKKLTDLDDVSILSILVFLDGSEILAVAQVCHKLRSIVKRNLNTLERKKSTLFDVYIALNKETGREDVRALKRKRLLQDPSYNGASLRDVVPPLITCPLRIFFGNKVLVGHWISEISSLYSEKRLLPISLTFTGGSFTRGTHRAGADLRCFTETGFINFIRLLSPDLKEVQLFKLSFTPRFLFSMINMLSVFGIVYERPPLRYFTGDLCQVIQTWQNSSRSHTCEVYIARPHGSEEMDTARLSRRCYAHFTFTLVVTIRK
ncbi:unnamed protein product [Cylicocyclus nassatus]|uniref:F-box domain-containing protein n=1 Tax=Cylicocyclus nassatus TaxID=53992 RepID=A0AA36GVE9_CYLNA|nr:unnamed protein product [Cylicocyclus nassatus]